MRNLNEDYSDNVGEIEKRYDKLIEDTRKKGGIGFRSQMAEYQAEKADELAKAQKEYDRKARDMSEEEVARTSYLDTLKGNATSSSFLTKAATEGLSFLGSIGQAGTQQSIVFNFNGDVSDIDALKKAVVDALNREAQLRGVAGK
jgi:hypothetical protein